MSAILLASASPRRRELLVSLGFDVKSIPQDIDETDFDHMPPAERVVALAHAKAARALATLRTGGSVIIGADTLVSNPQPISTAPNVFLDRSGAITLGKPRDREEARQMICLLAGRIHAVHTGIAVIDTANARVDSALSTSAVRFGELSDAEIESYLDSSEWDGVAGGYRIQGLAALFIEEIRGSWSGIVGLPIHELYAILSRLSIKVPALLSGKFPLFGAR